MTQAARPASAKYLKPADYARYRGQTPAWVGQMKKKEKIVMQGRMVNVAASDERLADDSENYITQAAYARLKGWDKAYITQLKQAGKIVMQGGKVDVKASDELIAMYADPNLEGTQAYHAQQRARKAEAGPGGETPSPEILVGLSLQKARALKEMEFAKQAKRQNEEAEGKLLPAEDVRMTVAEAGTVIRQRLETLPDTKPAQYAAETDENTIRADLFDYIEQLMTELSRQMRKLIEKQED